MINRLNILKIIIMPFSLLLVSCDRGKVIEQNYYRSPDGRYVVEQLHREAGLNSVAVKISIGTYEQKKNSSLTEIFYGKEYGSDIYWKSNDKLIIVFCGGKIRKFDKIFIDASNRKIHIQLMTGAELNRDGKPVCGFNEIGNYNGYSD